MKFYNITKGQLITAWICVFMLMFWADSGHVADIFMFISIVLFFGVVFYTIGWRKYNSIKNKKKKLLEKIDGPVSNKGYDELYEDNK